MNREKLIFSVVALISLTMVSGFTYRFQVDSPLSQPDIDYFRGGTKDGEQSTDLIFKEVTEVDIKFYLYTRAKPQGYRLFRNYKSLKNSGFNRLNPTKIIIHGYLGYYGTDSTQLPKNAYLSVGEYNVVAVDWSLYAIPYAVAVNAAKGVGRIIGNMIAFLVMDGGAAASDVHVIGHSLGAHIAGYAGSTLGRNLRIGRITGLDPAAPAFSDNPPNERLDAEDAEYVDVIHTSIRLLGMTRNIGHADFYPHGGKYQPGCNTVPAGQVTGICDHAQSHVYFTESIRNRTSFPATSCVSLREALEKRCSGGRGGLMGEDSSSSNSRGIYYVNVNHRKSNLNDSDHGATSTLQTATFNRFFFLLYKQR